MKKQLIGLISIIMLTSSHNAQAFSLKGLFTGNLYDIKAWNPTPYIVRGVTIHTKGACQKSDTSDILPGQIKERSIGACTGVYITSDHLEYVPQQCMHSTTAYNQNLGTPGMGGGTMVMVSTGGQPSAQPQGGSLNVQGVVSIPVGDSPSPTLPTIGTSTGSTIWFMLAVNEFDENGNCVNNPTARWVRLMDAPF